MISRCILTNSVIIVFHLVAILRWIVIQANLRLNSISSVDFCSDSLVTQITVCYLKFDVNKCTVKSAFMEIKDHKYKYLYIGTIRKERKPKVLREKKIADIMQKKRIHRLLMMGRDLSEPRRHNQRKRYC